MSTEIEIQVRPIFSTPLLLFTLSQPEELNAALAASIIRQEAATPAYTDNEVVGWSSPHDMSMLEWAGAPLRRLFGAVVEVAKQVTEYSERVVPGTSIHPDWEVVEVWANVQRKNGSNASHPHPGSFWSGVYYVDVGDVGGRTDNGGELQLYDPRGCLPRMLAPYLRYSLPELHDAGRNISLIPSSGQCVLFPGWLFHAVNNYRGKAPRISIAFNLAPVISGTRER
jgi:uncharacterized protein (TIGR02466 family)